jgi:hypothetical protein
MRNLQHMGLPPILVAWNQMLLFLNPAGGTNMSLSAWRDSGDNCMYRKVSDSSTHYFSFHKPDNLANTANPKIIDVSYQLSTLFSTSLLCLLLETVEIMRTDVNYFGIGSNTQQHLY